MAANVPRVELRVEVGLEAGPRTPSAEIVWTDLSDRLLALNMSRGRQGVSQGMPASTATIELDCEDGALDPSRPGGLVDFAAGSGLPGSPVRVRARVGGAGTWRPIFYGYLAEDAWRCRIDRSWGLTSTITAVCKAGLVASWESAESVWAAWAAYSRPDLWLRGAGGDSLPNNNSLLLDSSGNGREIRVFAPSGSIGALATGGLMPGSSDGAIAFAPSVGAQTTRTYSVNGLTMACLWRSSGAGAQEIMGVRTEGGVWRLRVSLRPEGHMAAQYLNSSGAVIGEATVSPPAGQTWNNNRAHVIVVRYDVAARTLALWVDGRAATASGLSTGTLSGRFRVGGGTSTDVIDEWIAFDRVMSSLDIAVLQNIFLGDGWPWHNDTIPGRFNRWVDLAGLPRDAFDNFELNVGADDGRLDSLKSVKGTVGGEMARLAESGLGEIWTTRAGRFRLRTRRALDAPDHYGRYREPVAHLTDEPDPSTALLPVRRTHPVFSGGRIESVITASRFKLWNLFTREIRNDAAIERFGVRLREWESLAADDQEPARLARLDVQDHATPRVEMEAVTVDPQTDPAAVEFVTNVELEQTVWFTWTDRDELPWLVETAVQGMRWRWSQSRWLVDLLLAPHPGRISGSGQVLTRPLSQYLAVARRDRPRALWPLWEQSGTTALNLGPSSAPITWTGGTPTWFGVQGLYGGREFPVGATSTVDLGAEGAVTVEFMTGAVIPDPTIYVEFVAVNGDAWRVIGGSGPSLTGQATVGGVSSSVVGSALDAFQHVSIVMGAGGWSVRINGVDVTSSMSGPVVAPPAGPGVLRVGTSPTVPFDGAGWLNGLAVYDRALTNRERDDHYRAAMLGVLPDPDAPQGYGVFTGGTVHDAGGWRYHTFTESGTLGVVDPGFADVLVVDGGAGGAGGGGGGGAVWEQFEVMIATSQPVTVGAGGAAIQLSPEIVDAQPGGASSLGSLVVGGSAGQGGSADYEDITADGRDGTTGGGGGGGQRAGAGGAGTAGGDGGAGGSNATGGGGGAGGDGGAAGGGGDPYQPGNGGVGIQSTITGDWYGGGGGGGGGTGAAGGAGGGGKGVGATAAEPGAANTGGGGGGGGVVLAGREGGSGIVVIRTKPPT